MDPKTDEESSRRSRRLALRELNQRRSDGESSKALDSSLKKHTALIKRMKLSIGTENRDQILRDIEGLALEKYVDELAGAAVEGVGRCKTEKDVWSAAEVISAFHRRFPTAFTSPLVSALAALLLPTPKSQLATLTPELREKDDSARISRQRPVLRVCSELALIGVIRDGPNKSGGEWIMKAVKELLSNDPTLSSLPLLSTFLKSYSRSFLGLTPPAGKQLSADLEPGTLSADVAATDGAFPKLFNESEELVERETRDRFKRMCEGYFDSVSKKLVIEHKRLQEQDRRNHEAYIRSGEIFEDRQQAYEKMTKNYEKLLASCQTLSELLYTSMPDLPAASNKGDTIGIGIGSGGSSGDGDETIFHAGGKWEDEEERRFYEDVQDLKDFVPKAVLGLDEGAKTEIGDAAETQDGKEKAQEEQEKLDEEMRKMEAELEGLKVNDDALPTQAVSDTNGVSETGEDDAPTPTAGTPKETTPTTSPRLAPQGPSQMLTSLLARLPDCTNRAMIDQAAVDFAFLNSKAGRKRLVRFLGQTPKNRSDLLPHYSRFIATLNPYMPDVGTELVAVLDEEFRYLQRKKNVVKELSEVRMKNIHFISHLVKFGVVPTHLILHIFKVCLDDFSGTNVENIAMLLEGCGRFLLRSEDTRERFGKMVELMRKKQSLQHFDQRQILLLENAYYQCNPPERGPREEKVRTPMELFIRHLIHDVLSKKTIDKVLKLLRKLDWEDAHVRRTLHKVFTKPWALKYGSLSLLAMLTYDLQRHHPEFTCGVVDQVLEDVRRGLETNAYKINQRRVATAKLLGELYIYRLISSSLIFDTLWSLVTFGHPEGHPIPLEPCPIDMPDDFFRVRLVCVLLDTCGMCFDSGSQKKRLDNFLTFFQYYVKCKEELPMDVDFMLTDSLEAVRPKLNLFKTVAEAAQAVDDMFSTALGDAGLPADGDDDSGGESDPEADRPHAEEEDDDDDDGMEQAPEDRAGSPEQVVHVSVPESLGPSEEEDGDFARELARMITDTSADARKVDKRTAAALWDAVVLPPTARRRREDEADENSMTFTLVTKRGAKQQVRAIDVPAEAPLAVQTRSAQRQDKEEQQHLKRLVLDYEQREEAEERKALENQSRFGGMKIRFVG